MKQEPVLMESFLRKKGWTYFHPLSGSSVICPQASSKDRWTGASISKGASGASFL